MNRRVTEKVLLNKHLKFMASIEDERVRDLVNKNSMITGGAIASLLLNEPVSDFDYYFTDLGTTRAVAEYYVNRFNGLNPDKDIKPTLSVKDGRVKIIVKSAGVASEATDKNYQYFETLPDEVGENYMDQVMETVTTADETNSAPLDKIEPDYRPIFMSSNAITLSGKVQLVIRFYGPPEEVHKNYDFIHCCNYWLTADHKVYLHPDALESLLSKNLAYQGSLYPICSIIRLRKFMKRGWYINAGQMLKIMFQISQLDLTNIEVLEEQLTGVDAAYFHQVINYCKSRLTEDKEFKLTVPYLVSIIEKIFG